MSFDKNKKIAPSFRSGYVPGLKSPVKKFGDFELVKQNPQIFSLGTRGCYC